MIDFSSRNKLIDDLTLSINLRKSTQIEKQTNTTKSPVEKMHSILLKALKQICLDNTSSKTIEEFKNKFFDTKSLTRQKIVKYYKQQYTYTSITSDSSYQEAQLVKLEIISQKRTEIEKIFKGILEDILIKEISNNLEHSKITLIESISNYSTYIEDLFNIKNDDLPLQGQTQWLITNTSERISKLQKTIRQIGSKVLLGLNELQIYNERNPNKNITDSNQSAKIICFKEIKKIKAQTLRFNKIILNLLEKAETPNPFLFFPQLEYVALKYTASVAHIRLNGIRALQKKCKELIIRNLNKNAAILHYFNYKEILKDFELFAFNFLQSLTQTALNNFNNSINAFSQIIDTKNKPRRDLKRLITNPENFWSRNDYFLMNGLETSLFKKYCKKIESQIAANPDVQTKSSIEKLSQIINKSIKTEDILYYTLTLLTLTEKELNLVHSKKDKEKILLWLTQEIVDIFNWISIEIYGKIIIPLTSLVINQLYGLTEDGKAKITQLLLSLSKKSMLYFSNQMKRLQTLTSFSDIRSSYMQSSYHLPILSQIQDFFFKEHSDFLEYLRAHKILDDQDQPIPKTVSFQINHLFPEQTFEVKTAFNLAKSYQKNYICLKETKESLSSLLKLLHQLENEIKIMSLK